MVDRRERFTVAHPEAQPADHRRRLRVGRVQQDVDVQRRPLHVGVDPQQPVGVVLVQEPLRDDVAAGGHVRARPLLVDVGDPRWSASHPVVEQRGDHRLGEVRRHLAGMDVRQHHRLRVAHLDREVGHGMSSRVASVAGGRRPGAERSTGATVDGCLDRQSLKPPSAFEEPESIDITDVASNPLVGHQTALPGTRQARPVHHVGDEFDVHPRRS